MGAYLWAMAIAVAAADLWLAWRVWCYFKRPQKLATAHPRRFTLALCGAVALQTAIVPVLFFLKHWPEARTAVRPEPSTEARATAPPAKPALKPAPAPTSAPPPGATSERYGNALLVAPGKMDQYEPYVVRLQISEQDLAHMIAAALHRDPKAVTGAASEVLITRFIEAELTGDDFSIEKKEKRHSVHKVDPRTGQVSDWYWTVAPQNWGGNKKLTAHIYALDDHESDFVRNDIATKDVSVSVSVSGWGWLQRNAADIAKLILLPIGGCLLKALWDRLQARKKDMRGTATPPLPEIDQEEERKRA